MSFKFNTCSLCKKGFYTVCHDTLEARKHKLLKATKDIENKPKEIESLCVSCFSKYLVDPNKLSFEVKLGLIT